MDIRTKFSGPWAKVALLPVLLAAITFLINRSWFDQEIHPNLVALSSPKSVSLDGNAFPMIHGFAAGEKKDFVTSGREMINLFQEKYEQREKIVLSAAETTEILEAPNSEDIWQSSYPSLSCNSRLFLDCADRLISEVGQQDQIHPRLGLLLERYEIVRQAPRFEESQVVDGSTPLPSYGLLMQISRIRLATRFQRDSSEQFLVVAAEDLRFWRLLLRDSQSLIAKMVALAGFRNSVDYLSALMRHHDLDRQELQSIRNLLRPLTDDELDIGDSFLAELRISILSQDGLFAFLRIDSGLARAFSQKTATLNEYYLSTVVPMQNLASLDAESFFRQRGYEQMPYSVPVFPPPLYNLGGKLALKRFATEHSMQDYISRMHDVNGRLTVILLQAEIEENPEADVETVVNASIHRNPYSGESIRYDADTQTLDFECLPSISVDVCGVTIGRPSN